MSHPPQSCARAPHMLHKLLLALHNEKVEVPSFVKYHARCTSVVSPSTSERFACPKKSRRCTMLIPRRRTSSHGAQVYSHGTTLIPRSTAYSHGPRIIHTVMCQLAADVPPRTACGGTTLSAPNHQLSVCYTRKEQVAHKQRTLRWTGCLHSLRPLTPCACPDLGCRWQRSASPSGKCHLPSRANSACVASPTPANRARLIYKQQGSQHAGKLGGVQHMAVKVEGRTTP